MSQQLPFLSSHLNQSSTVPRILPIGTGVYSILVALLFIFCGSLTTRWGPNWRLFQLGEERWLKGGVGGALGGMGATASIAIIIMMLVPSHHGLSPVAVYSILASTSVVGLVLGGRFKWVGRFFLAGSGGLSLTLLLLLSFRFTTLLPRLIVLLIIEFFSFTLSFLPLLIPSLLSSSIPSKVLIVLSSLGIGSFLFAFSIDLFLPFGKTVGWVDSYGLLTGEDLKIQSVQDDEMEDWRKATFKAILAAAWIFGILGIVVQWFWWKKIGEDPDEQWNSYLASIVGSSSKISFTASGTKGPKDRKGTFSPEPSMWEKIRHPFSWDKTPKIFSIPGGKNKSPFLEKFRHQDDEAGGVTSPLTDLPQKKERRSPKEKDVDMDDDFELFERTRKQLRVNEDDEDSESDVEEKTLDSFRNQGKKGGSKPPAKFEDYKKNRSKSDLDLAEAGKRGLGFGYGKYYKSVKDEDNDSGEDYDEKTLIEDHSMSGEGDLEKGLKSFDGLGISNYDYNKVMKKVSPPTSPKIKPITSTPLQQVGKLASSPANSGSSSEDGASDLEDQSPSDLTMKRQKKGMVASISKIFENNKSPSKYEGNNNFNLLVENSKPSPQVRTRRMSADFSNKLEKFQRTSSSSSNSSIHSLNKPSNTHQNPNILAAVPATPSLIYALNRVNKAQNEVREALNHNGKIVEEGPQDIRERTSVDEQNEFWKDVDDVSGRK